MITQNDNVKLINPSFNEFVVHNRKHAPCSYIFTTRVKRKHDLRAAFQMGRQTYESVTSHGEDNIFASIEEAM